MEEKVHLFFKNHIPISPLFLDHHYFFNILDRFLGGEMFAGSNVDGIYSSCRVAFLPVHLRKSTILLTAP